MRKANALIVAFVALAVIVAWLPGPAYAQVVTTTTSSFVNKFGNTVTITETYIDGVLSSRDYQEVRPDGTLTLVKQWDFYASGTIKFYEEQRLDGFAPYKIQRQYDESGIIRSQYAELYINGELAVQSFLTFDAQGFLVTEEERVLTTLADGTKVWRVTYEIWSGSTLVSAQIVEYPYGYDFNAGDGGSGDSGSGDDGSGDESNTKPGYGYGDNNHEHTGPPGQDNGSSGSSDSSGSGEDNETRPGQGRGDSNHEHTGPPGNDE